MTEQFQLFSSSDSPHHFPHFFLISSHRSRPTPHHPPGGRSRRNARTPRRPRSAAPTPTARRRQAHHHLRQTPAATATQGRHRTLGPTARQAAERDRRALAAVRRGQAARHLQQGGRGEGRGGDAPQRHRPVGGAARQRAQGGQVPWRDPRQSGRVCAEVCRFAMGVVIFGHKFLDHSELFIDQNTNDHISMRVRTRSKLRN